MVADDVLDVLVGSHDHRAAAVPRCVGGRNLWATYAKPIKKRSDASGCRRNMRVAAGANRAPVANAAAASPKRLSADWRLSATPTAFWARKAASEAACADSTVSLFMGPPGDSLALQMRPGGLGS